MIHGRRDVALDGDVAGQVASGAGRRGRRRRDCRRFVGERAAEDESGAGLLFLPSVEDKIENEIAR